jgi:hypothetical protein
MQHMYEDYVRNLFILCSIYCLTRDILDMAQQDKVPGPSRVLAISDTPRTGGTNISVYLQLFKATVFEKLRLKPVSPIFKDY